MNEDFKSDAPRISGANIIVPPPAHPNPAPVAPYVSPFERWSSQQKDRFRLELDHMLRGLPAGTKQIDQAIIAITACIDAGVDTEKAIIRMLYRVGFEGGRVAKLLEHNTGPYPKGNHWKRDRAGRYFNHPSPAAGIVPPPRV